MLPVAYRVETLNGSSVPIFDRHFLETYGRNVQTSPIFSTSEENQTELEIHVLIGEAESVACNRSYLRCRIFEIPPGPSGSAQIEVTFTLNQLHLGLAAKDLKTGKTLPVKVWQCGTG